MSGKKKGGGSQAQRAMQSGHTAIEQINIAIAERGLTYCPEVKKIGDSPGTTMFEEGMYAREVLIGKCSYYRPMSLPFVLYRPDWKSPLCVEMQNQVVGGSTDAKLVKAMRDLCLHDIASVIILCGDLFTSDPGIIRFARTYAASTRQARGRILRVFIGISEFSRWAVEGMPWPGDQQAQIESLAGGR